jgi:hypothetical protein
MKIPIKLLGAHQMLYQDPKTGLAWVEDGSTGLRHSCHPNIDQSGSVEGMRQTGAWGRGDIIVRSQGFAYNVSRRHTGSPKPGSKINYSAIAAEACQCRGCSPELWEGAIAG